MLQLATLSPVVQMLDAQGYRVVVPDSSRDMLPEVILPLMDALQELGHTPVVLSMNDIVSTYRDIRLNKHGGYELFLFYVRDLLRKGEIDFALSAGLAGILEDSQKAELHYLPEELGIPGLLYLRGPSEGTVERLLNAGAANWSSTLICCDQLLLAEELRDAGVGSVCHLTRGYSPRVFYPKQDPPANAAYPLQLENERLSSGFDLSFVGQHSKHRESVLASIQAEGVSLAVFGDTAWTGSDVAEAYRGPVNRLTELNTVLNASKIVLDLALEPAQNRNGEDFDSCLLEALGSGACVLAEERPGLGDLAAPGEEITASTSGMLPSRALKLLNEPAESLVLAERGLQRARRDHQWVHRLRRSIASVEMTALRQATV